MLKVNMEKRAYNFKDLSGCVFTRLTVTNEYTKDGTNGIKWKCICTCGAICHVLTSNLTGLKQKSCGCLSREMINERAAARRTSEEEKREGRRLAKKRYNNTEKGKLSKLRYYNKNKDQCDARSREWSKNNKDVGRSAVRNRRARLKRAEGSHTKKDIINLGMEQGWKCAICFCDVSSNYHIDHVVAISKGGTNDEANLQLTCPSCNVRKSDKELVTYLRELKPGLFNTPKSKLGSYINAGNYEDLTAYAALMGECAAKERT